MKEMVDGIEVGIESSDVTKFCFEIPVVWY